MLQPAVPDLLLADSLGGQPIAEFIGGEVREPIGFDSVTSLELAIRTPGWVRNSVVPVRKVPSDVLSIAITHAIGAMLPPYPPPILLYLLSLFLSRPPGKNVAKTFAGERWGAGDARPGRRRMGG